MPKRRQESAGLAIRAARLAGWMGVLVWSRAVRRPVDSLAMVAAVLASGMIIVNAAFLQSGARSAPYVFNPPPPLPLRPKPPEPAPAHAAYPPPARPVAAPQQPIQAPPTARHDPIGDLIGRSSRILAVQRALTDYGYGQIKPTGIIDAPTSAAIEKFEREHNLPVTGRMSDRLVAGLEAETGHPLE